MFKQPSILKEPGMMHFLTMLSDFSTSGLVHSAAEVLPVLSNSTENRQIDLELGTSLKQFDPVMKCKELGQEGLFLETKGISSEG